MESQPLAEEFKTPEAARTIANYLRSNMKSRSGVEHERRVDFFKGKKMVECILEGKKWPKSLPKVTDKKVAILIGEQLLRAAMFHRSEKLTEVKKAVLVMSKRTSFDESGYYTWMYEGSLMMSHIATGSIIFVVIACTLLPLWPMVARIALWYVAVTFLLALTGFVLIRSTLFLLLWVIGIEFWILPNFFDESLQVIDSFKPIYSLESGSPGHMMYRFATMMAIFAGGYYVYTQPTDWDVMMKTQQTFVDDLYAGKLLPDAAQTMRDTMANARMGGKGGGDIYSRNMPKLDEILNTLDIEEEEDRLEQGNGGAGAVEGEFDSDPTATTTATTSSTTTSRGRSSIDREMDEVVEVDFEEQISSNSNSNSVELEYEHVGESEESASDMMDRLLQEEDDQEE